MYDVQRAVARNRHWSQKLGWLEEMDAVVALLGFVDRTPGEEDFALAVFEWQRENGLGTDGVLGPDTWRALAKHLRGDTPVVVQREGLWLADGERMPVGGKQGHEPRRADAPSRLVLHTTETYRLPTYARDGTFVPPHVTVGVGDGESLRSEERGRVRVWQHLAFDRTAYALSHRRSDPETNHMGAHCVQVEIVTRVGGDGGNGGRLPHTLLDAVAGVVARVHELVPDIDLEVGPPTWSSDGSAAYGRQAPQRLTWSAWEAFNGVCGHQHVPGNAHWDPGGLDIEWVVAQALTR